MASPLGLRRQSRRAGRAKARRAFIACDGSHKLRVLDLDARKVEAREVGSGPDVLAEDIAPARVYVASESGTVSVFE